MRKLKIKATKIKSPECYHLQFKNHYEMCLALVRIQEFYESSSNRFREHHFSLEEYMDWYSQEYGKGVFTYPDDWDGFNIPSHILGRFLSTFKWDLRPWELDLIWALEEAGVDIGEVDCDKHQFYVIGTVLDDNPVNFKHELCHGLFYMNSKYRAEVERVVKKYKLGGFRKKLLKLGYSKLVLIDEIQAYLLTETCGSFEFVLTKEVKALQRELRAIRKEYVEGR